MTDLAGRLQIELRRTGDGLAADIRSSRPVAAGRVFAGKGVQETAALLPALFSVCATAQAVACAQACEAALGMEPPPPIPRLRELLTRAETVREHLWRMLLDWPRLLGEDPQGAAMAGVMGACGRLRTALGDPLLPGACRGEPDIQAGLEALDALERIGVERVFGMAPAAWLDRVTGGAGLKTWAAAAHTPAAGLLRRVEDRGWAALGRSPVPGLPPLSAARWEVLLGGEDADDFVAAPLWQGRPAESSPLTRNRDVPLVAGLSRRCHNGLVPRLAAQLTELASLLVRLRGGIRDLGMEGVSSAPVPRGVLPVGVGIARVQAARGLLVHRVFVRNETVVEYRILAPTEWNFHPAGPVAAGLAGLPPMDDDDLLRFAGLFVIAVDPCVDYAVNMA
jgi:coenzyme F420-reducing hydrogenase alpha subunit